MSSDSEEFETKNNSNDLEKEADAPPETGKRNSSPECQDFTQPKKKKKGSDTEQLLPEKEETVGEDLSSKSVEDDSGEKISINTTGGKQKNPLTEEKSEEVTESDKSFQADGIPYERKADFSKGQVKDLPSKDPAGKRSSSPESHDVTKPKKKKKASQTASKSPNKGFTSLPEKKKIKIVKKKKHKLSEKGNFDIEKPLPEEGEAVVEGKKSVSKSVEVDSRERIPISRIGEKQTNPLTEKNVTESDTSFKTKSISCSAGAESGKSQVIDLPPKDSAGKISSSEIQNVPRQKKKKIASKSPIKSVADLPKNETLLLVKKSKHKLSEQVSSKTMQPPPEKKKTAVEVKKAIRKSSKSVEDDSGERNPINSVGERQANTRNEEKEATESDTSFQTKSISHGPGVESAKSQVIDLPSKNSKEKINKLHENETFNLNKGFKQEKPSETTTGSKMKILSNHQIDSSNKSFADELNEISRDNDYKQESIKTKKNIKGCEESNFCATSPNSSQGQSEDQQIIEKFCIKPCRIILTRVTEKDVKKKSGKPTLEANLNPCIESDNKIKNQLNSVQIKEKALDKRNKRIELEELTQKKNKTATDSLKTLKITDLAAQSPAVSPSEKVVSNQENVEHKETNNENTIRTVEINDCQEENQNQPEELNILDEAQTQGDMSSDNNLSHKENKEPEKIVCENTIQTGNINDRLEERGSVETHTEEMEILYRTGAGVSSEQILQDKEKIEFEETSGKNTLNSVDINYRQIEKELIRSQPKELNIPDETKTKSVLSLEPTLSEKDNETVCESIIKTGDLNYCQDERKSVQSEEFTISEEAKTQAVVSSDQIFSDNEKSEHEVNICENTIHRLEERGSVETHTEEMENLYQTGAGVSSEQILQDKEKIECEETIGKNTLNSVDINYRQIEKELIRSQPKELNIPDETKTKSVLSLEPTLSEKDNETVCESIIKTGDLNYCQDERKSVQSEEFTISEEAKTQAVVSSDQIFSDNEKSEHEVNICENTIHRLEERGSVETHTEEMENLYQTGAGVSSEQILQDKEKIECEETIGKNTLNSVDINYRQIEKELIRSQPKELNIPDETKTKSVLSLEPTLSEKDNETVCESIIKTGDLNDCQDERKSVQSEEFTISEESKTQAVVSSDQIFSDNDKSEHEVNICENTIQTGNINDRPEEIGSVENQAEEMDISDEEDNISQSSDENVKTPIQLPEKENNRSMSYKDPVVDDPVWRDRLPPPPGCESPSPPGCESPPPPSLPSQDQISSPPQCKASSTLCVADIMKSAKQSSSGLYEIEFEINHLPKFTVDYVIKKALRENEVKTFSGATVRSTGIYTPFGTKKSVNKVCDKPLNLYIKALTLQSLAMALACVLKVITEGEEDENIQVDQVFVSLPHAPTEFKLNDRLVGEGGSNLQYITEQTGAEVTLRGQGSGYLEHTTGLELPHPLHLRIRHSTAEGLKLALDTASNLLQTVGDELNEFCNQGGQKQMTQAVQPTMVPVPVPTAVPTIVPAPVPTAVPTIVPAPVPTAVLTIVPAPVPTSRTDPTSTPSAVSTIASNSSIALGLFTPSFLAPPSGPSVLAGSSSAPLAPFTPKVGSSFATTSSSVLSNYKTAAQLITQAGNTSSSTTKVVYESGPQLKSQSSSKTFVSSAANTSLQTASSFQFRVPPPPMPKPHPKRTSSNVTVPPPIRNTPPTTPHHPQPSASSSLTRPPYKKEEIQMKDYKSTTGAPGLSPTSMKAGNKPKKIHFSIVTAVKQGKVFWANPLLQKKTSSSEDQDRTGETEKSNPPRKASGAETEKNRKGSRWGQKPEDVIETSKVSQLLARVEEQVNKMPSGGDKTRLETTLRLLKTGVPLSPYANEEELSQFKIVLEILKKTLEYLPSNQLSKTLWEIFRTLKKDFDIVTDERSPKQQDKKTSYKKTEPLAKEVIAENEADSRETSRRRDKKRSAKSPVREQSPEQQDKKTSYKKTEPLAKEVIAENEADSRETSRRRDKKRSAKSPVREQSPEQQDKKTSYKKTEPLAKEVIAENEADSRETSRRRDKKRSAKSPVREQKRESSKSSSSTSYSRSSRYLQDSQDRKYSYKTSYYNRSDKLDKHTSIDSSQEQKRGETKKSSFDDKRWKPTMTLPCHEEYNKGLQTTSSNRKTDSELREGKQKTDFEVREEKQKPVTKKAEVYLPKPSKSSTCDELNKIVELLHIALKNASDSLKHDNIKSEFYKIAQLLDHALPSGVEATDEQKSQFSIVLDVLEQALQRNSHALGPQSARLSSIIALLKSLLNTNSESANLCKIEGNQNPSMSPSNTVRPTQTSSDIRPVPEIKAKNELNDQQSDQLTVIAQLLQKAIQNYANSVGQSNLREQLAGISKWLEEAVSNRVKSIEKKQSNLLYVLKCLEQLLTNNPSLSNQPKELLGIMQTFKHALQSKPSGSAADIQKNVSNPMDKTSNSLTGVQRQNTPSLSNRQLPSVSPNQHKSPHVPPNEHQSQLLEIIKLLKKALDSYYSSMEPGYLRSQLTQFSQLLDRALQENSSTTPPDQLKKQMAPLVQLLQQLLKNQQTSNSESKQLLHILQLIEKNLNPPVVMNPVTPLNPSQPANIMGSLQQLQMLQLQQQMQSGSHTSMALPFQPVQMQTAPIANNVLQLQLMQQMQQMQAALGTLQQQPANHLNNKLTELSQQMQSLQQQFSQVSQLNQQQPYQTMSVPQQQPFLQSLSTTGPQSFLRPATGPQSFVQPATGPQSFVQPATRPQSFVQPGTRSQSFVQPATQPQLSGLPGTLQEPNLSEFMRQLQQQFKRGE